MDPAFESLTSAEESMFLTLVMRAVDFRMPHPILNDERSAQITREVDYDFDRQKANSSQVRDLALRSRRLDDIVRRFATAHPDGIVVELGAGLDPRRPRCKPPETIDWYDVDFPAVMAIRERFIPETSHPIGADLTTTDWLERLPTDRPAMLVADGLMAFMTGEAYKGMIRGLTTHLDSGEFAFNAYSRWDLKAARYSGTFRKMGTAPVGEGIDDPHEAEDWGAGLTLVEELLLSRDPIIATYPEPLRTFTRLCARSVRIARSGNRLLHYRF